MYFLDMQEHGLNLNQGRFTIENSVNSIIEIIENSTKEKRLFLSDMRWVQELYFHY